MSEVRANKFSDASGVERFLGRSWGNFNGTATTPDFRASGNTSSLVDNGTGDYTVNLASAMPDVNFGFSGTGSGAAGTASAGYQTYEHTPTNSSFVRTTTSIRFCFLNNNGSAPADAFSANFTITR